MSSDRTNETTRGYGNRWTALGLFGAVAVIVFLVALEFRAMWQDPPIYPGPGVTGQARLSDYFPGIDDTAADTDVYFLEGTEAGGTPRRVGPPWFSVERTPTSQPPPSLPSPWWRTPW